MLGVFSVRLTGPFTYTVDRTNYFGPLNFGTRLDQKAIEDWTGPDYIDRVGLGRSLGLAEKLWPENYRYREEKNCNQPKNYKSTEMRENLQSTQKIIDLEKGEKNERGKKGYQ